LYGGPRIQLLLEFILRKQLLKKESKPFVKPIFAAKIILCSAIDPKRYPVSARMAERLARAEGQAHYRRRKVIPEPVFGWIKHVMGFRQFSWRGLTKVKGEWSLVCLALNVRRMWAPQN
jgi:DDE family transposase